MLQSAADLLLTRRSTGASISGMNHNRWTLDPSRFPKRLDLELSDRVLDHLGRLSAKTGRSVSDLASDLLCQALADQGHPIS